MEIEIIDQLSNGVITKAQSKGGRYQWFFGQDGYIRDTVEGRSIYQMAYLKLDEFGSDPLPDDVEEDVRDFLASLRPLVNARREAAEDARIEEEAAEIAEREAFWQRVDSYMDPEER